MTQLSDDLLCGNCGYQLRGISSDRCPECGRRFDPNHLIANLIPWEQRGHVWRIWAFAATVHLAMFRPRELVRKTEHPVSRSSAKRFQALVVIIATAAILSVGYILFQTHPELFRINYQAPAATTYFLFNPISIYFTLLAGLPWLACATMLPAVFANRRTLAVERRNRAVAVCRYACAPLVPAALAVLLLAGTIALRLDVRPRPDDCATAFLLAAALIAGIQVFWAVRKRRVSGKPRPRMFNPVVWTIVLILAGVGFFLNETQNTYGHLLADTMVHQFAQVVTSFTVLALGWWWAISVRLVRLTSDAGPLRTAAIAAALPVLWIVMLGIFLATMQAIQFMVAMLLAWP